MANIPSPNDVSHLPKSSPACDGIGCPTSATLHTSKLKYEAQTTLPDPTSALDGALFWALAQSSSFSLDVDMLLHPIKKEMLDHLLSSDSSGRGILGRDMQQHDRETAYASTANQKRAA